MPRLPLRPIALALLLGAGLASAQSGPAPDPALRAAFLAEASQKHGLSADEVKALMRRELAPGSYRAWRRRVRRFSDRRASYK